MYKIRKGLSISDKGKEILTIEIISKESKNMLFPCCYIPLKGINEKLTAYFTSIFQGVQNEKKSFIISDFNLTEDSNIKYFYHKVFELGFIPLIDKPTRVYKNSATIIDNILINCLFDNTLKKAIIKSDISDHFELYLLFKQEKKPIANSILLFIKIYILVRQTRRLSSNNYFFSIDGI